MNNKDQRIVIIGAGTAGLTLANKLAKKHFRPRLIDPNPVHYYQPGLLSVVFGDMKVDNIKKSIVEIMSSKIEYISDKVTSIDPLNNNVTLTSNEIIKYDALVIATGAQTDANLTQGLLGDAWQQTIFEFYSPEGATELADAIDLFSSGHLIVHVAHAPAKYPLAPLEFCFLADEYFTKKGVRQNIKITYLIPSAEVFAGKTASDKLTELMRQKNIELVTNFKTAKVDSLAKEIVSPESFRIRYDMLVTVPVTVGMKFLQNAYFTSDLGFVKVNPGSLQSTVHPNIFSLGDSADIPMPKAGSVAHYQTYTVLNNILNYLEDKQVEESYDGHASHFVAVGNKKALLLDFNYQTEPLEGKFPFASIGPLRLLRSTKMNYRAKKAFRYIYWFFVIPGRKVPFVSSKMSKKGKKLPIISQ